MSIVRAFITRLLQESKSSLPTSLTPAESGLLVAQGPATCSAGNVSLEQSCAHWLVSCLGPLCSAVVLLSCDCL